MSRKVFLSTFRRPASSSIFLKSMHITISSLPPELLDGIILYTPAKTQLDLRHVSRLFNSIATPRGYQALHLESWPQILKCFKTLSGNLIIAKAVRSVLVHPGPGQGRPILLSAAYEIISRALENISPNVVDLNLVSFELEKFPFPAHCPHLRNFCSSLCFSENVVSFLSRHPKLEAIALPTFVLNSTLPQIRFSSMVFLACPSKYIMALAPGSPLSHVSVLWDSRTTREEVVVLFASLKQTTVPLLAFSSFGWTSRVDMFSFVAQGLSHLRQICFGHFQPSVAEQEILAKEMNEILPCLKNLLSIEINWFTPPEITPALLDNDLDTITRWGHLRPSLEICRMPCRIEWRRVEYDGSAWIPHPEAGSPHTSMCRTWLKRTVTSGGAPEILNALKVLANKITVGESPNYLSQIRDSWRLKSQDIVQYRGLSAFGTQGVL